MSIKPVAGGGIGHLAELVSKGRRMTQAIQGEIRRGNQAIQGSKNAPQVHGGLDHARGALHASGGGAVRSRGVAHAVGGGGGHAPSAMRSVGRHIDRKA